ncbi:hypothetical protein PHLGIDRAFT_410817 [Phlebiopsis gigantea 11061_1 CR5-6]|uniref:Uncharacterized protein n=1 Tax=Phlebiopsis gigantea (strain 11061_1 CR5-6) TaxID=745531 RepID=A0A0C3S8V4_PHLG1|nr:hypothetical protein PHLGIDRAFT_410817 [Phlebiopsis gigantea 11061_1 CR5-6]
MSTPRKRPECRTCNMPMAGHKRPHGWPVCPPRTSPAKLHDVNKIDDDDSVPVPQIGKYWHFINPNYRETYSPPPGPSFGPQRSGTPCTWVSTEPADDIPSMKHERTLQRTEARHIPDVEITGYRMSASSIASISSEMSSPSARQRRSFYSVLTNSLPAVSLFSAPRGDIATITQTARMNGLHTGVMRRPRNEVKEEGSSSSRIRRGHSWWVLLGKDPVAVEHLLDLQEKSNLARLDKQAANETDADTTAPPPTVAVAPAPSPFPSLLINMFLSIVSALLAVFFFIMFS